VLDRFAHGGTRVEAAALEDDPDPLLQAPVALFGILTQHPYVAGASATVALEDLDRRRLARAVGTE